MTPVSINALYDQYLDALRQRSRGNVQPNGFARFFNLAQVTWALSQLPEVATLDSMSKLSILHTMRPVQLTAGIGSYDFPGFLRGPLPLMSTQVNTGCGDAPNDPVTVPIRLLTVSEFADATMSRHAPPTFEFPVATMLDNRRIEVRPRAISYITCLCWRTPRDVSVGLDPGVLGWEEPLEGGQGQVNPEFDATACNEILAIVLELSGSSMNDGRLMQAAATTAGGQR